MQGDTYNFSGKFIGTNINIKSTLTNVHQIAGALPHGDQASKGELQGLVQRLNEVLQGVPPARAGEAEAVATMTQNLVESAKAEKPNKTLLKSFGYGLKTAAQTLGDVLPTVVDVAAKIMNVVEKISPS